MKLFGMISEITARLEGWLEIQNGLNGDKERVRSPSSLHLLSFRWRLTSARLDFLMLQQQGYFFPFRLVSAPLLCITWLLRTSTSWQALLCSSLFWILSECLTPRYHPPALLWDTRVSAVSTRWNLLLVHPPKKCLICVNLPQNLDTNSTQKSFRFSFLMAPQVLLHVTKSALRSDRIPSLRAVNRADWWEHSTRETGSMSTVPAELPSLWSNALQLWMVL